jgi:hypothetical protein
MRLKLFSDLNELVFSEILHKIESMTRPFKKSATFSDGNNFGLNHQGYGFLEFSVLFSMSNSVLMAQNLNLKLDLF